MPDNPLSTIPGGVFGAPATTDPLVDQTTHQLQGGGSGGSFPITFDDGTNTYTIAVVDQGQGPQLDLSVIDNATGFFYSHVFLNNQYNGDPASHVKLEASTEHHYIDMELVTDDNGVENSYVRIGGDSDSAFLMVGGGDPNGVVTVTEGSLFIDTTTPALWQNTDNVTAWTRVGGGTFPLTFDDGTYTYTITASGSILSLEVIDNETGDHSSIVGLDPVGGISILAQSSALFANLSVATDQINPGSPSYAQFTMDGHSAQVFVQPGNPNGSITAPQGSIVMDILTPAIWQNTDGGTVWTQVGVSLSNLDDIATADSPTIVLMDGTPYQVHLIMASPPSWMDTSGNIILPGIYRSSVALTAGTGATIPGKFMNAGGCFAMDGVFPVDYINAGGGQSEPSDVGAIAEADLPFLVRFNVRGTADATATITCQGTIQRLVY